MRGVSPAEKERRKVMEKHHAHLKELEEDRNNLTGFEKLRYDLGVLETHIKSCKYDLQQFKNNAIISNKLKSYEEQAVALRLKIKEEEDKVSAENKEVIAVGKSE